MCLGGDAGAHLALVLGAAVERRRQHAMARAGELCCYPLPDPAALVGAVNQYECGHLPASPVWVEVSYAGRAPSKGRRRPALMPGRAFTSDQPTAFRLSADCLPLRRSVTSSNSTFWPSLRVPRPARSIALIWTKASLPPLSGWMKPKPLAALNHLTVPVVMGIPFTNVDMLTRVPPGAEHRSSKAHWFSG